jgi:hypothetical protein
MQSIKNILRLLFLLSFAAIPAKAVGTCTARTATVVQTCKDTGSGATRTALYSTANGVHDTIVAAIFGYNSTTNGGSCSDTSGNSYAINGSPLTNGGSIWGRVFVAKNIAAASANTNTISCTISGQAFSDMVVGEVAGMSQTTPVDTFGITQNGGGTNNFDCATACTVPQNTSGGAAFITTVGINEVIVTVLYAEHINATYTINPPATGYTVYENTTNPDGESAALAVSVTVATAPGSYQLQWNSSVSNNNVGAMIIALTPGTPPASSSRHRLINSKFKSKRRKWRDTAPTIQAAS